jgi:hypothetical protein
MIYSRLPMKCQFLIVFEIRPNLTSFCPSERGVRKAPELLPSHYGDDGDGDFGSIPVKV